MKASRLLGALNELTEQEGMYLRGGYYELAVDVRQRADPLVHLLADLAEQPEVRGLRPGVMALVEKSASHAAFIREKLQQLDHEIRRTDQARFRTAKIIPAYAPAPDLPAARFEAAG